MASNSQQERHADIERNQASLRDSIEQSRRLSEQSQQLIQRHRDGGAASEPHPAS